MEGLKLIDLGNEVSYIDVDTSKVPYTFSVKLGDRTFAFSIRYNEVGGFFTVDLSIASTGEVLVYGDIVRYGRPLFNSVEDERFPVPVIIPATIFRRSHLKISAKKFGCTSGKGMQREVLEASSDLANRVEAVWHG